MTQNIIEQLINDRLNELVGYAENIGNEFNNDIIQHFKDEFKMVRSLVSFIRVHKGEKSIKIPEKCKDLYKAAGAIRELQIELQQLAEADNETSENITFLTQQSEKAKNDWNKNYTKSAFTKLQKELVEFNYKTIRGEFLDNFFTGTFQPTQNKKNNEMSLQENR